MERPATITRSASSALGFSSVEASPGGLSRTTARASRRSTFELRVRGMSGTTSTCFGRNPEPSFIATCSRIACA